MKQLSFSACPWRFVAALLLIVGSRQARTQLVFPPVTLSPAEVIAHSAAEAEYQVHLRSTAVMVGEAWRDAYYPIDSMHQAIATYADTWVRVLRKTQVEGVQLEPASRVGAMAGEEAYARQQIAARLAEPRLTLAERASAYLSGVQIFADSYHPERLASAEQYLAKLDAMGDAVASWQFDAHVALGEVYYLLGRSADVARHGGHAMALIARMPFYERQALFKPAGSELYMGTIDALAGQPGGRERITQINTMLREAVVPPPALVAVDSGYAYIGMRYMNDLSTLLTGSAMVGTVGAPIISNYWLNRPTRDSAVIPVTDGKIRVLTLGHYSCPGCLVAMVAMGRVQQRFPHIQVIFGTSTQGWWANRLVEPDEEATKLTDAFLNNLKATVAIALWKGKKVRNEDEGLSPENWGPNFQSYPALSKPTIWVLDGHGRIRRIFLGFSREKEVQLVKVLQFLERESTDSPNTTTR